MAVANKTVISFGLVAIPIAMYTAVQNNDISFNQLHKTDHERIRYKKVCKHCNQEVKTEDIIKGYQYDKENYIVITDEDIERIKTEKEKSIQIIHFANLNQISPIYYDKAYHVLPEAGGEKAFELLRKSLMDEQKIAIGKTVMGSHESLMAIIPREDGMVIQTMYFEDEIKEIPKSYKQQDISEQELTMAKMLIGSMDTQFDAAAYKDEYQEKLRTFPASYHTSIPYTIAAGFQAGGLSHIQYAIDFIFTPIGPGNFERLYNALRVKFSKYINVNFITHTYTSISNSCSFGGIICGVFIKINRKYYPICFQ